jgi:diguanylate cyclase (GGDEF)-like protein/PAS domain S-box-containing protein
MSVHVLLVSRSRGFSTSVAASNGQAVTVEHVASLADAMTRLEQNDFQAVALDLDLPDAQGFEALSALTAIVPDLPVLVLGDDTDMRQQTAIMDRGAEDYLLKARLDTDTLTQAVHCSIARKARERVLFNDKELAQVTMKSIGDGVLSTDAAGLVTFLNPVAERLTGWTIAEAVGLYVSEIFEVIDASTRERIVPQLALEVQHGLTMIMPPNCLLVRRDGQESPIEDSAAPIFDRSENITGMVVVFHDVSEARAMAQKITHLAEHDVLTSLPNRALLDDRLKQAIALARRHTRQLAVLFIDLDHFKHVNDSLGHPIGDQLLKAVSQRIGPCVRRSDTVGRQGGDEFIVLLSEITNTKDATLIAEKIRLAVSEPYQIADHYVHLSASIGVSIFPGDGEDAQRLIQSADTAMYHAKEKGRNNCQFFKEEMNIRALERQALTEDLRHALARNELFLEYQPKIDLHSGAITGIEALLRWHHPKQGLLHPERFIPIAEDCGLIMPIGQWVMREACIQAQQWYAEGLRFGTIAVNISAVEFRSDRFFEEICGILRLTKLGPEYLELELTETAVMRDYEKTCVVLQALSAMGVRIAVDDFGTGYSNLSYLKRFPIDTLKLDKSFIHAIAKSANNTTLVSSVIDMAHSLNLQVVAEGVETAQQLKFLRAHECGAGQGFYFSKPVSAAECRSLLSLGEQRWAWEFSRPAARRAFR